MTAAALAITSIFGAATAHAGFTAINPTPYAAEQNIDQVLSHVYGGSFLASGNDYSNGVLTAQRVDDSTDQGFTGIVLSIKALARFAGFDQTFGYVKDGVFHAAMTTSGTGYGITGSLTGPLDLSDGVYSAARTGGGTTVAADDSFNSDGLDHMVSYELIGLNPQVRTFVLFFEDLMGPSADRDFNDLAVEVTTANSQPIAVPLPGSIGMGLATLAGAFAFRKRIRATMA
jgi:hypothetical protein